MSTIRPLPASAILHTLVSSYRRGRPRGDLPCRVRVGCAAIDDDVLCGGVQRGVVLGLSADVAGEGVGRVVSEYFSPVPFFFLKFFFFSFSIVGMGRRRLRALATRLQ
jgi:hypothetical protein